MDTAGEGPIENCINCNNHQIDHCGDVIIPTEQPVTGGTHARRGTDGTSGSSATFVGSKYDEELVLSSVKFQTSSEVLAPSPGLPAATVDGEAGSPQKRAARQRWERFCSRWLTAYRVLGSGIVLVNLATLVFQIQSSSAVEVPLTATAANILAAVMMRQEEVINLGFKLVSKLPSTLPFAVRRSIGDLHHYGGVHVGSALSALIWYIAFAGLNTVRVLDLASRGSMTTTLYIDIITAYAALLVILVICTTAIPRFRIRCHNAFELTHRFGGWLALLVLWLHAGTSTLAPDVSTPLYTHPSLWLLTCTTLLVLLPWLRIRRVPITVHRISAREATLTFPYPHMPHTSTLRTSTTPLTEWHAFATIPLSATSAQILISQAGDWTASLLTTPPSHLWIRRAPTLNFLACVPLFTSLLLVATGAGIGPLLSLLASPAIHRMRARRRRLRVMWCVAAPLAAHWAFVLAALRDVDVDAVVFDSRRGRPDVAVEARELVVKEALEAVMVVSNPRVTREVVATCKAEGVAAYGAVFDS